MDAWMGMVRVCVNCFHIHDHLDMGPHIGVCTLQIYCSVRFPQVVPATTSPALLPFINTHPRNSFPWIQNVTNIDPGTKLLLHMLASSTGNNMEFCKPLMILRVLCVKWDLITKDIDIIECSRDDMTDTQISTRQCKSNP